MLSSVHVMEDHQFWASNLRKFTVSLINAILLLFEAPAKVCCKLLTRADVYVPVKIECRRKCLNIAGGQALDDTRATNGPVTHDASQRPHPDATHKSHPVAA